MKKTITSSFVNKLYLLLFVVAISITQSSCLLNIYSPSSTLSMTGTTSYCQGAVATPNTLTYDQCTLGGGIINSGTSYTAQWYFNTTGGTTIGTSTPYGAPISGTSSAGGPGTESYTPSTATPGTFYYFCYFTWAGGGTCTPDFTSTAQTVVISAGPAITGTATVCQGQTTTLSTTATGGVWSSSNTTVGTVSTSGVVAGLSPGTTTIGYTVAGCMGTRVVTVNAGPSAITPTAATTICQGTTVALSSSPGGGSWSSSAPTIGTVSASGLVGGTGGGVVTISYTNTTSGCYVTKPVTVTPTPTGITGPSEVCPGTTIVLTPSTPGGTWSSSTPANGTVSTTGVVTGIAVGTTTITYTGCGFVTKDITVNPLPAPITGTLTVCETAGTTTLSSTTLGGTWSSSSPANATATTSGPGTGLITGVSDGTTTITYTSIPGCITTANVTVNPAPEAITGAVPICAGQSMMLSNAVSGGTWSSSNAGVATVSSGGLVTGMAGGTAFITYANACGFSTVNVTINALPAPIEGRDTVCVGSTTAFTNPTLGGTWSSAFPVVASVLVSSGLISGHFVGSSIITYTMPGGCYVTRPVYIEPMPPAITGTTQACPGTTTTLFNAMTGGYWMSGSPSIATINVFTGVVTGVAAGTASITYNTTAGCPAYATVLINPLPEPIIGADVIHCAADKDTLFNATPGGTWSSLTPGVATINPTTGVVSVINGGTAIIRYTLPTGCGVSKSISVNPAPTPTVTYNNITNTFYTETTWGSYQWHNAIQGAIPGANTWSTAALYYTDYWVVVSDGNDCFGPSAPFNYNSHTAVYDPALDKDKYTVYPNPSTSSVFVDAPVAVKAVVTTIDGKVLISQENAKEINISKLADGMYMMMLYDESGVQRSVHKLVKH